MAVPANKKYKPTGAKFAKFAFRFFSRFLTIVMKKIEKHLTLSNYECNIVKNNCQRGFILVPYRCAPSHL